MAWKESFKKLKMISYTADLVLLGWEKVGKKFQQQLHIQNWIHLGGSELPMCPPLSDCKVWNGTGNPVSFTVRVQSKSYRND